MLPTSPCIKLIMFCMLKATCHGYIIYETLCKQYGIQPIREESGVPVFTCSGTDDNMKWEMYYYINSTYSYWQTIATCSPSGCTNLQENRYVATRPKSSESSLKILHADRVSVGQHIRCCSLSGNQFDLCELMLYYESTPSDCRETLDRAAARATVSCVTNKFYFSSGVPECRGYLDYETSDPVEIFGKLEHSTIVDHVTGREYENGTCSMSTNLSQGYGTYVYRIALSFFTKNQALPVYILHFAPEQTTLLSPVQISQQAKGGSTVGTASTATPSAPEKTTQPAPGDGTGGDGNTGDSGDKFTLLYALVGVGIVLIIAVGLVVLWNKTKAATHLDDRPSVNNRSGSTWSTVTSGHLIVENGSGATTTTVPSDRDENHYDMLNNPTSLMSSP